LSRHCRIRWPARLRLNREGEWTSFWITLAVVIVGLISVSSEFAATKSTATNIACGLMG
jgi:hypothetical protein